MTNDYIHCKISTGPDTRDVTFGYGLWELRKQRLSVVDPAGLLRSGEVVFCLCAAVDLQEWSINMVAREAVELV